MATPVSTIEAEAKQALQCRHADLGRPAWLVDATVGAALRLELLSLEPSSTDEARLRGQPPHEVVEVARETHRERTLEGVPADRATTWAGPLGGGRRTRATHSPKEDGHA